MLSNDFKTAVSSLRGLKWRSILAVLSIIVFVASITTIMGLGSSVKHQLGAGSKKAGQDLITIRPGSFYSQRKTDLNLLLSLGFGGGSLSPSDLKTVKNTNGVGQVSAINYLSGSAKSENHEYTNSFVFGVEPDFQSMINHDMDYGAFINSDESNSHLAIIGQTVAEELFKENIPIGRNLTIRGENFVVKGVFEPFQPNTLVLGSDFNKAVFIPYATSREISAGGSQIVQILVKPTGSSKTAEVVTRLRANLLKAHNGQNDLTVLSQSENLTVSSRAVNRVITLSSVVAGIALIASGIGVMNIMLLAVNERTREIGIRKALGATSRQLLRLFWLEALTLSIVGALLGIFGSLITNYLLHIFTDLKPRVSLAALFLASVMALAIGLVFGLIPAMKASRKDPIEALRHHT